MADDEAPAGVSRNAATRLPADEFYRSLLAGISVSDEEQRSLSSWLDLAVERVLTALRPHLLDVDAVVCGSVATGTLIHTSDWDVDIVIRVAALQREWASPDHALGDLHRWLSHSVDAEISQTAQGIRIFEAGSTGVDVIACWRTRTGQWSSTSPSEPAWSRARTLDPVGHRDLMLARQRSLGDDTFAALIRVVKHLNARWRQEAGTALGSYDIDALALELYREPVLLADALPQFLEAAAQECADRARTAERWQQDLWSQTEGHLRQAADLTEQAIATSDQRTAFHLLGQVFGDLATEAADEAAGF